MEKQLKDLLSKLKELTATVSISENDETRCTECGINDTAIGLFMGNSIGKLKDAYTDVSDDFLLAEGRKLCYDYPKITPKTQHLTK